MDWDFSNFRPEELACRHTGQEGIKYELMVALQSLRDEMEFPFIITSGYRSLEHPIEAKKKTGGTHSLGLALDILCSDKQAFKIVTNAAKHGFTGIGVNQKGSIDKRFIHLDIAGIKNGKVRPKIWSY